MFSREPRASARRRPALARSSRLNERSWFSLERFQPVVEALFVLLYGFGRADQLDVIIIVLAFKVDGQHPVVGPALCLVVGIDRASLEQVGTPDVKVRQVGIARLNLLHLRDVIDSLSFRRNELFFPSLDVRLRGATEAFEDDQLGILLV